MNTNTKILFIIMWVFMLVSLTNIIKAIDRLAEDRIVRVQVIETEVEENNSVTTSSRWSWL